jgi:hypothetical protein
MYIHAHTCARTPARAHTPAHTRAPACTRAMHTCDMRARMHTRREQSTNNIPRTHQNGL